MSISMHQGGIRSITIRACREIMAEWIDRVNSGQEFVFTSAEMWKIVSSYVSDLSPATLTDEEEYQDVMY